jgi:hypothetical protein
MIRWAITLVNQIFGFFRIDKLGEYQPIQKLLAEETLHERSSMLYLKMKKQEVIP